ncbi:MAG: hypothetical protein WA865_17990, partial [Spirulinaceae cyanobacterium]
MAFRIQSALIFLFLSGSIFACGEAEVTKQPQVNSPSQTTETSWQKVQGEGITLNLPPSFAGGNPSTDINVLEEKLKTIAPDYENKLELLKQNPGAVALLAFDTQSAPQQGVTSINVRPEKLDAELT